MGRRREAEKGGGLRQTGVGVKEAESWGGVTEGMCPGRELGVRRGRSLGSRQPLCLGLLSSSLPCRSQGTSLFSLPPPWGPCPFILLPQLHPPAPLSGPRNDPGWLFQLHQPAWAQAWELAPGSPLGPSEHLHVSLTPWPPYLQALEPAAPAAGVAVPLPTLCQGELGARAGGQAGGLQAWARAPASTWAW